VVLLLLSIAPTSAWAWTAVPWNDLVAVIVVGCSSLFFSVFFVVVGPLETIVEDDDACRMRSDEAMTLSAMARRATAVAAIMVVLWL